MEKVVKICRICTKESHKQMSIFNEFNNVVLAVLISEYAQIEITKGDGLPTAICYKCAEEALAAHAFILKCQDADKNYRHHIFQADVSQNETEESSNVERTLAIEICKIDEKEIFEDVEYILQDIKDEAEECDSEITHSPVIEDEKIYKCCGLNCLLTFENEEAFESHIKRTHRSERNLSAEHLEAYECPICFSLFPDVEEFKSHQQQNVFEIKCDTYMLHFDSINDKLSADNAVFERHVKEKDFRICCGCNESFKTQDELMAHSEKKHSIHNKLEQDDKAFRCNICFKWLKTKRLLKIHQKMVYRLKKYQCSTCGKGFDVPSKLYKHEVIHTAERNFRCEICEKTFKNRHDLAAHKSIHAEKQQICTICGFAFYRKSELRRHMTHHSDESNYPCTLCEKKFKSKKQKTEHFKVHTGEKPYACSHCDKTFAYYSDHKRHEVLHTGNYPFECKCSRKFTRKSYYLKHAETCQFDINT